MKWLCTPSLPENAPKLNVMRKSGALRRFMEVLQDIKVRYHSASPKYLPLMPMENSLMTPSCRWSTIQSVCMRECSTFTEMRQLPNGLHYEWTVKALLAGKHVLLEKPATSTAEESRALFALAEKKGLVVLEAFHFRYNLIFTSCTCLISLLQVPSRNQPRQGHSR